MQPYSEVKEISQEELKKILVGIVQMVLPETSNSINILLTDLFESTVKSKTDPKK